MMRMSDKAGEMFNGAWYTVAAQRAINYEYDSSFSVSLPF